MYELFTKLGRHFLTEARHSSLTIAETITSPRDPERVLDRLCGAGRDIPIKTDCWALKYAGRSRQVPALQMGVVLKPLGLYGVTNA